MCRITVSLGVYCLRAKAINSIDVILRNLFTITIEHKGAVREQKQWMGKSEIRNISYCSLGHIHRRSSLFI